MNIPLWMTEGQAQRLKQLLEQQGFINVAFDTFKFGEELGVSAKRFGRTIAFRAAGPEAADKLPDTFRRWARGQHADKDAYAATFEQAKPEPREHHGDE